MSYKDPVIEHTHRELELAGAFGVEDGTLGKAVLATMKVVQHFAKENQELREAIAEAVRTLSSGGLLSDVTDDPNEWVELKMEESQPQTWSNKRNPFFVSQDGGKHWHHLPSKQDGTSKEVSNDIHKLQTEEGNRKGDGGNGSPTSDTTATGGEGRPRVKGSATLLEKDESVEVLPQHSSIQRESDKNPESPQSPPAKPTAGEAS